MIGTGIVGGLNVNIDSIGGGGGGGSWFVLAWKSGSEGFGCCTGLLGW